MPTKIFSCHMIGLECSTIEVQADITPGLPVFSIVGLTDTSVQESKHRVRSSIKNSDATFPPIRKTINLAPAQVPKHGSHFDLPIAVSLLADSGQIPTDHLNSSMFIGELGLGGELKPIIGALPMVHYARQTGFKRIFLPQENADEVNFVEGIKIYPLKTLKEFIAYIKGAESLRALRTKSISIPRPNSRPETYYIGNIIGLHKAKRALEIAAAGGHNVLLSGSPGCGKTLLARALKEILPPMTIEQSLETTKIYSVSGLTGSKTPLVLTRPFREVHHTASLSSIIGGGSIPRPGEISLAHNGILFFDEIAEFPRANLEALRQPLEDLFITINRNRSSIKYPSNFIFAATMNPCPCGYLGDTSIRCVCTQGQIRNYQKRLSGPLLDRFDLFIDVEKVSMGKSTRNRNNAIDIINRVTAANKIQTLRFTDDFRINQNSDMKLPHINKYCKLTTANQAYLERATEALNLSNRGYFKTLKTARTIADLATCDQIQKDHLAEAIQYRRNQLS